MSADGLRAAKWIARVQPQKAAVLAAELRNAVTPAHVAVQELQDSNRRQDLRTTVAHILALADELQPEAREVRAKLPTMPEPEREVPCPCCEAGEPCEVGPHGGRACSCCMNTGLVPESYAVGARKARAELIAAKRRKLAPPDRDSSGGHEL